MGGDFHLGASNKSELNAKKVVFIGVFVTTVCILVILGLYILAQSAAINFTVFNFASFVVILISVFVAFFWANKTGKRSQ